MDITRSLAPAQECQPEMELKVASPLANLKSRRQKLLAQVERVEAAIDALEKNPEVTRVIELLAKANY